MRGNPAIVRLLYLSYCLSSACAASMSIDGWHRLPPPRQSENAALTGFQPAPAFYADARGAIDTTLPNARLISNALFASGPLSSSRFSLSSWSSAFGQMIAHTLSHTLTQAGPRAERFNISVPRCDRNLDPACAGGTNILFTRAVTDPRSSVEGVRRQVNGVTGWLDGSTIYGSSHDRLALVRAWVGGRLLEDDNGQQPTSWGLPLASIRTPCIPMEGSPAVLPDTLIPSTGRTPLTTPEQAVTNGNVRGQQNRQPQACSLRVAGDVRTNIVPGLVASHAVWAKEHNWWARRLQAMHPSWSDERLFHEAKKRTVAELQAVVYNEYIPTVLRLSLPAYRGYRAEVDPRIAPSFAQAAFRFGHSAITTLTLCLRPNGRPCTPTAALQLRDSYFRPDLYTGAMSLGEVLRGLVEQSEEAVDTSINDAVRLFLAGIQADLVVLDITRGRDFGLPSFTRARQLYGLAVGPTFDYGNMTRDTRVQSVLRNIYGETRGADTGVHRVDLWVGGLVESAGSIEGIGETFRAVLLDQFARTRDGDPLFYLNADARDETVWEDATSTSSRPYLSDSERAEIHGTRMSDIMKRVSDYGEAKGNVFIRGGQV